MNKKEKGKFFSLSLKEYLKRKKYMNGFFQHQHFLNGKGS